MMYPFVSVRRKLLDLIFKHVCRYSCCTADLAESIAPLAIGLTGVNSSENNEQWSLAFPAHFVFGWAVERGVFPTVSQDSSLRAPTHGEQQRELAHRIKGGNMQKNSGTIHP